MGWMRGQPFRRLRKGCLLGRLTCSEPLRLGGCEHHAGNGQRSGCGWGRAWRAGRWVEYSNRAQRHPRSRPSQPGGRAPPAVGAAGKARPAPAAPSARPARSPGATSRVAFGLAARGTGGGGGPERTSLGAAAGSPGRAGLPRPPASRRAPSAVLPRGPEARARPPAVPLPSPVITASSAGSGTRRAAPHGTRPPTARRLLFTTRELLRCGISAYAAASGSGVEGTHFLHISH